VARILVSGSTGFIGKHLVRSLIEAGHDVMGMSRLDGDIANLNTWCNLPPMDVVIHLASRTFVPDSWNDPLSFVETNLNGTICCLEYCRMHNSRLIYLSSYLYGNPEHLPISESANLYVNNPYGLSKKIAEESCTFYFNNFGVKTVILRPFNVYGPGQSADFLIPIIIDQVISRKSIEVKDLNPKRDYIYIDDLIRAIIDAIELDNGLFIFNLGSGISYSVAEVIECIQRIEGTTLPVKSSGEKRPGEIMETKADISKAKHVMGWSPRWSLELGIAETISEIKKKVDTEG
jgi:GDP-4-dehydro-6-deoxy-D-mannose reductase